MLTTHYRKLNIKCIEYVIETGEVSREQKRGIITHYPPTHPQI